MTRFFWLPLLVCACDLTPDDDDDTDKVGDTSTDSATDSDSGSDAALSWYTTCGDPACQSYDASMHTNAPCTSEVEGDTCSPEGAGCDLEVDCNVELICATEDPKDQPGGCPISLRAAKEDIVYIDQGDKNDLHRALMQTRLARYRYRAEPMGEHLGFLIDDQPAGSPAVLPEGGRVSLYGYTSMAVAALQVHEETIAHQRAQLEAQAALLAQQQAQLDALAARLARLEGPEGR